MATVEGLGQVDAFIELYRTDRQAALPVEFWGCEFRPIEGDNNLVSVYEDGDLLDVINLESIQSAHDLVSVLTSIRQMGDVDDGRVIDIQEHETALRKARREAKMDGRNETIARILGNDAATAKEVAEAVDLTPRQVRRIRNERAV